MGIRFTSGGFLTTVQDWGREGFQQFGVPVSGVMDRRALRLANILVGNDEKEGVLEITIMGPMADFTTDAVIAVTGGDLGAKINGKEIPMYRALEVKAGDSLSFGPPKSGSRAYLAVAGGFDVPAVMGSKSTNMKSKLGGFMGRKLGGGDELEFIKTVSTLPNMFARKVNPESFAAAQYELRVIMGPQDDTFTEKGIETFLSSVYTMSNESDRMGCRMEGDVIEHKDGGDIITDGLAFGAVQIPSHGQPIIMMSDHQTTGGYTKIANVISVDLPKIAQGRPGCRYTFKKVTVEEAQELYMAELSELKALKESIENTEPASDAEAVAVAAAQACARKYSYSTSQKYRVTVGGKVFEVELEQEHQLLP